MYKIMVHNTETGVTWWEYGFSRYMMKRIHFLKNETDIDNYEIYSILWISKICFSIKTFKKCLTNATELC